jgi:hypothetical protein
MAYFSNGSEGENYIAAWCSRCRHWTPNKDRVEGCPVFDLHLFHNYDKAMRPVLNHLIPPSDDGLSQGECKMFIERPSDGPMWEGK